ncbi:helicase-exonuclease AddAB subunit AddA [Sporolactobacillus vineae]|uniref:helicase-exonuclease AddAB subunit AddA n=1 Tax=Sporolactobacillus vineae TaxID=444463 RepID=UPI0002889DF2|nr:helicase-exonuclease AddAB subunit AddA [Sporolactobacillus vineae]
MAMKKPEGSQWTDEQWQAITEEGHDLLVAAAAGSGKTAVLVERIIRKILSPDHRTGIDDLLVVTFTNAAAAEMRERIGRALDQQIIAHPDDPYLRTQQTLLSKAAIMTLHAFCLSVIKKNYYTLDIDPGFRLLDETEAGLLREEVLDDVLENHYSAGDADFYKLVDQYSGDRSDELIRSLVLRIYTFSMSDPWPNQWLGSLPAAYQQDEGKSIDDFSWTRELKKAFFINLTGTAEALRGALALCKAPGGPEVYAETLSGDLDRITHLLTLKKAGWENLRAAVSAVTFPKLRAASGKNIDRTIRDQVRKTRDQVKKVISGYQQDWFARNSDELLQDVRDMAPSVSLLVQLVREFTRQFSTEKRSRGVLDFSDLEHECLSVLRAEDAAPDHEKPSAVALQYQKRFAEVLVDEYQDTNRVQEAILKLVKKGGTEGNLFMVGDVKQSIYGFRLAEPGLFRVKYKAFSATGSSGAKIDLSSNFRSRREIIDGTNFLFRQTMDESSGGVNYDQAAELKFGASYPDGDRPVDLELIDRSQEGRDQDAGEDSDSGDNNATELEAAAVSDRIKAMIGDGKHPAFQVCDRKSHQMRPLQYRDIAILMRSATTSAAVMKDVLSSHGIPAYAELTKGYFDTVEVSVMLSVLQIIDNSFQDIPLASVLRSPIVGLNGDELARIRISREQVPYFAALKAYAATNKDELSGKLSRFLTRLEAWQDFSKTHSVSALVWQIYRDTGYYDYAGGLFGGTQRQANLKAFYDRARLYEKTSFRGLFRFLRFISRMRETGGDLGEARALSEQEDVVRIMTIHKSKGLEFPVVFLTGIDRKFNRKDLSGPVLLHKTLGFGTRWIDPDERISVPTLPYLAIQEQLSADAVAEEMRILYVAVTRAREKLILVGAVKDPEKKARRWASALDDRAWLLPDDLRRTAATFLDWIGPCLVRHRQSAVLQDLCGRSPDRTAISRDPSEWNVTLIPATDLEIRPAVHLEAENDRLNRMKQWRAVVSHSGMQDEIRRRLEWKDPHRRAAQYMAKQTVTEIKSQQDYFSEGLDDRLMTDRLPAIGGDRPRFLQEGTLSPTERGTALHILMQHLDLIHAQTAENVRRQGKDLVAKEILTAEQEASLDYQAVLDFLSTDVGRKMKEAARVLRECPFSLTLPAGEVYPDWGKNSPDAEEKVLIQGVIDCIIEDGDGLILLDYKTDRVTGRFPEPGAAESELKKRYQLQLGLYRLAVEKIWKRPVTLLGLYAFDGGFFVDLTAYKGVFS